FRRETKRCIRRGRLVKVFIRLRDSAITVSVHVNSFQRLTSVIINLLVNKETERCIAFLMSLHRITDTTGNTACRYKISFCNVREVRDDRIVHGSIETEVPCKIICFHRYYINQEFQTVSFHLSNVSDILITEFTCRYCNLSLKLRRKFLEPVE